MAINKVEANGETLIDLTNDTATASDVIEGKTLHLASGEVATGTYRPSDEIEARLRATVGHSNKNLLDITKYTANTNVSNIQLNETTGSLSFTGTGTFKDVRYNYDVLGLEPNNNATYIVSCINNLVSTTSGRLAVRAVGSNIIAYGKSFSTTGAKEIIFTADPETFPDGWYISIMATDSTSTTGNIDISNLMLREASISDDAFEPYQEPTDSLIEIKTRAYLNSTVGHACKNLYQITADTQTIRGVTYTVDQTAGTITANGTSPSDAEVSLKQLFVVTPRIAGEKLFSVSLNQVGSSSKFDAYLYDQTDRKFVAKWDGSTRSPAIHGAESQEVLLIEGHTVEYTCRIFKNQTVSNLIYKPMIRDGSIADDTFEPYRIPTDELIARLDQRIHELERINEKPTADLDEGQYFITVFNDFGSDCDIWLTTPIADGGAFYDKYVYSHWVTEYHRPLNYYGKRIMVLFRAGTGNIVMALNSSQSGQGRFYKEFDVDEFLDMCDFKDGSATNYISIHLCDDGGIRSQAEYEAYIGS